MNDRLLMIIGCPDRTGPLAVSDRNRSGYSLLTLMSALCQSEYLTYSTAFHSFQHRNFIGVLNVAAHGDAHRDPRDLHSSALQLLENK